MDTWNESSHQEEFAVTPSPVPVQQLLFQHWMARYAALGSLAREDATDRPPNKETGSILEWMGEAQKHIEETNRLLLQIRRIECYLGRDRKSIDPTILSAAHWKTKASWVRALIENGESDEDVASYLRSGVEGERKDKGRPSGAMNSDGQAMLALAIRDSDPKFWTWPKLADRVFADCKAHSKHKADDSCTASLRKAVSRLRKFIRELDSEFTVT